MKNQDKKLKIATVIFSTAIVLGAGVDIGKGHSETIEASFVKNLRKGRVLVSTSSGETMRVGRGLENFGKPRGHFVLGDKLQINVTYGHYTGFPYTKTIVKKMGAKSP